MSRPHVLVVVVPVVFVPAAVVVVVAAVVAVVVPIVVVVVPVVVVVVVVGPGECFFFPRGDDADFESLSSLLKTTRISGLICEFPSNPLLVSPDIDRLRAIADAHNFLLVCDDTVAGFGNVDVLRPDGVDLTVSSLTKQFAGSGNVMGGALVLNSHRPVSALA